MMKTYHLSMIGLSVLLCTVNPVESDAQTVTGTDYPMQKNGPYDRVYFQENLPKKSDAAFFPQTWEHAYGNKYHNAAWDVSENAPEWMKKGVSWYFEEARAWPLENEHPFAMNVDGEGRALATQTQWYGNALGVTAAAGIIYAESDDMFAYAINAETGKLIWRTSPIGNTLMGNPLVVGDMVFISMGSVGFNFSNVQAFAKTGKTIRGDGIMYNGLYALNRFTGELKWYFLTKGDAMPTPAYDNGLLYIPTGDGMLYAVNANNGTINWKTELGGIANMTSPAVEDGMVYVAMSVEAFIYGLDAKTGEIKWKGTIPKAANTGMGDVSPAVSNGIVVMDAVNKVEKKADKTFMDTGVRAFDAKTGKVLWTKQMGQGPKPPAFKGGVPMIHGDTVYIGTPVNSIYKAYNIKTGEELWTWNIPDAGPAGAGRGCPTWYKEVLYISTGPNVFALNPEKGEVIGQKKVGGRFGIVNPTIVGGTMYLGNSWDWVIALPLTDVNPQYKP